MINYYNKFITKINKCIIVFFIPIVNSLPMYGQISTNSMRSNSNNVRKTIKNMSSML